MVVYIQPDVCLSAALKGCGFSLIGALAHVHIYVCVYLCICVCECLCLHTCVDKVACFICSVFRQFIDFDQLSAFMIFKKKHVL